MTPIAGLDRPSTLTAWRVDAARHAGQWDSGEGARLVGGRWSPVGMRAIYASLDPATAILEVAVHKGLAALDTQPHVLTCFVVTDLEGIARIEPEDVPNPVWLQPGLPSRGQMQFGAGTLAAHGRMLVPSVVSRHSWNLVLLAFPPGEAEGRAAAWRVVRQEPLCIDTRLHPPM